MYGGRASPTGPHTSYSLDIVDDLIQGSAEWRHVPDIIRLTWKALSDVIRNQEAAMRDFECHLSNKANLNDIDEALANKANQEEVSKYIADLITEVDNKADRKSIDGVMSITDVQRMVADKASLGDITNLLDTRARSMNVDTEIRALNDRIDDMHRELLRRIEHLPTFAELEKVEAKFDVESLGELLDKKANKQSVANALHRKVNRNDVEEALQGKADLSEIQILINAIETKAEQAGIEQLADAVQEKIDRAELSRTLLPRIEDKLDKKEIQIFQHYLEDTKHEISGRFQHHCAETEKYMSIFRTEIQSFCQELGRNLETKANIMDFKDFESVVCYQKDISQFKEMVQLQKIEFQEIVNAFKSSSRLERNTTQEQIDGLAKDLETSREEMLTRLGNIIQDVTGIAEKAKISTLEINQKLIGQKEAMTDSFEQIQKELQSCDQKLKEKFDWINSHKLNKSEWVEADERIQAQLYQKAEIDIVEKQDKQLRQFIVSVEQSLEEKLSDIEIEVQTKISTEDARETFDTKLDISKFNEDILPYATIVQVEEIDSNVVQLQEDLESNTEVQDRMQCTQQQLQTNLETKANASDVSTLIDLKANIDDVNEIIRNINSDIDQKVTQRIFTDFTLEQATLNEAICAENWLGRWIWKSGDVSTQGLVPWEDQAVNTCPENFVWQKDASYIMMVTPGLYEISVGMFVRLAPLVSVQVNGENVLQLKGKKGTKPHVLGDIAGHTLSDFIALPARARIQITYSGEPGAEGFLHLRKL